MKASRFLVALCAVVSLLVSGCQPDDQFKDGQSVNGDTGSPERTLSIIAGSEQATVLQEVVLPWCRDKGYSCNWTLKGSVDQARMLESGNYSNDAFWFASSVFSQLGNTDGKLRDVQPMFLTPIVFAARKDVLDRLGLTSEATAQQVMDAITSGQARVWATNPTQSNSGATVLFSFLNFEAGNQPGQALTMEQLRSPEVTEGMRKFFGAIDRTPPSTGTMTTMCVEEPDQCEAMFTYEDLVIEKNLELTRQGKEPFHVVYPRGALGISDAPLGFVDHGQDKVSDKQRIFSELQDYLLNDEGARDKLLALGRRPAQGVGLNVPNADKAVFNPDWGVETSVQEQGIAFPQADVIQAALDAYHTSFRRPVNIHYCLDGSGSMRSNDGWDGVKDAAHALFDEEEAHRNLLQTAPEDTTSVTVFTNRTEDLGTVEGNDPAELRGLEQRIRDYKPGGGTDMYLCLDHALSAMEAHQDGHKELIVVMSDGKSQERDAGRVNERVRQAGVPVVSIAFGSDADPEQLKEVAAISGGAFVQKDDMVAALREAAGYR